MSAIVDISTAVAALLTTGKAAGWFDGFPTIGVIERQWLPNWEAADVQTLRIGVAPRGQDRERLARMVDTVEPVVLIGIMAHIPATADIDDPTTVDPYANLAVRIAEIIASGILPAPAVDAKLISVAHVIVDPEWMAKRVFYSLITTTWRVAEAVRIGLPPAPTAAPVLTVSDGVATCSTGTWLYSPTGYAYAWESDGGLGGDLVIDPDLGTTNTLALTGKTGWRIACRVTATNACGSSAQVSDTYTVPITLDPLGPEAGSTPAIEWLVEGVSLRCNGPSWVGVADPAMELTVTHQWYRNAVAIDGETLPTYTLTGPDSGASLTCMVSATYRSGPNAGHSNSYLSTAFSVP